MEVPCLARVPPWMSGRRERKEGEKKGKEGGSARLDGVVQLENWDAK